MCIKKIFCKKKKQTLLQQILIQKLLFAREQFENSVDKNKPFYMDFGTIYNEKYYEYDDNGNIIEKCT